MGVADPGPRIRTSVQILNIPLHFIRFSLMRGWGVDTVLYILHLSMWNIFCTISVVFNLYLYRLVGGCHQYRTYLNSEHMGGPRCAVHRHDDSHVLRVAAVYQRAFYTAYC